VLNLALPQSPGLCQFFRSIEGKARRGATFPINVVTVMPSPYPSAIWFD
jgi:hypothetical protein